MSKSKQLTVSGMFVADNIPGAVELELSISYVVNDKGISVIAYDIAGVSREFLMRLQQLCGEKENAPGTVGS